MVTVAMGATAIRSTSALLAQFDTDSKALYIDNCALTSITNSATDRVSHLTPARKRVKGIVGTQVMNVF
jgi:hypothetical protein